MTGVQGTSSDEIRGDWSNIKGTEYHLFYALWLILRKHARMCEETSGATHEALMLLACAIIAHRFLKS